MNIFICTDGEIECPGCKEIVDCAGGCGCMRKRCICGVLESAHVDGKFGPTNCQAFELNLEADDHFP